MSDDDDNVIPIKPTNQTSYINVECENCQGTNFKIIDFQLTCDHCWEVTEGYVVLDLDNAMKNATSLTEEQMDNIFKLKHDDDDDKDKD